MAIPGEQEAQQVDVPERLPLLPVRDIVVFPHMVLPLFVGREMSVHAIEAALAGNRMILLVAQKSLEVESPEPKDIYSVGTVGMIMRMLKLPDGRIKILIQGLTKARIVEFVQKTPYYEVRVERIVEPRFTGELLGVEALMRNVKEQLDKMISLGKILLPDVMVVIENVEDPGRLSDMVISNLGLKVEVAQAVLEIVNPVDRLKRVNEILMKELEVLTMQQKIQAEAKGEMDRTQREYYLREQMKAIQKELGDGDERTEEINDFRKRIKESKMPEKVFKEAEKQLKRLEKMHVIALSQVDLRSEGLSLKESKGDTIVQDLQTRHLDIIELTLGKLTKIAKLMATNIGTNAHCFSFTKKAVAKIIKDAESAGRLAIEKLTLEIRKEVESI